jgi:zinc and cadmium transporter
VAFAQSTVLLPFVLMVSAASFIYIALADLVPDLHRQSRKHQRDSFVQLALMFGGIVIVAILTSGAHAH